MDAVPSRDSINKVRSGDLKFERWKSTMGDLYVIKNA